MKRTTDDIREKLSFQGCDNVTALEMCDLIDQLREIVDRLPKTADGVPIFPYDEVWTWFPDKDEPETVTITRTRAGVYSGCYSTREAAEQHVRALLSFTNTK
jgi:hypothetical protein